MSKNKSSKVKKFLESKKALVQVETQENPVPAEPETAIEERKSMPRAAMEHGTTSRPTAGEEKTVCDVEDNTILIKRTIRSGQCIQYDGNIVVLGDVNPGSELIASGNVVVMGSLRGVVHAGATGNEAATVAAFRLLPTQLRIANHITRAPDGDYLLPEQPEIARIKDGVVVIEAYQINQDKQMRIC